MRNMNIYATAKKSLKLIGLTLKNKNLSQLHACLCGLILTRFSFPTFLEREDPFVKRAACLCCET